MSYMNSNAAFAVGVQELSFDEIEDVNGGVPMLLAVAAAVYGPTVVKATVATAAAVAGFATIYVAAHDD